MLVDEIPDNELGTRADFDRHVAMTMSELANNGAAIMHFCLCVESCEDLIEMDPFEFERRYARLYMEMK